MILHEYLKIRQTEALTKFECKLFDIHYINGWVYKYKNTIITDDMLDRVIKYAKLVKKPNMYLNNIATHVNKKSPTINHNTFKSQTKVATFNLTLDEALELRYNLDKYIVYECKV